MNNQDYSNNTPKGVGDCFTTGSLGGCGVECAVFSNGECAEPQEIAEDDVLSFHGDDAIQILEMYECYEDAVNKINGEKQ